MNRFSFFAKHRRTVINSFAIMCLVIASAVFAFAQTSRGTVSGVVRDPNGAVVPGASVVLVNTATTVERTSTTSDEGFYRFDAVDLGTYSVRFVAPNFGAVTKTGIIVNANQTSAIDAELAVGNQQVVV